MLWSYMLKGGPLMILIGISSVVALAVFLERFFYLRKAEKENKKFLDSLTKKVHGNELNEASDLCSQSSAIISANILKPVFVKKNKNRAELKDLVEESANVEITKLEHRIPILGTIASIAPLLGLLGTVVGMIGSLKSMETSLGLHGVQNTSDLLSGIWSALITTAAGLIVAIPSLTAYNYFVTKVNNMVAYIKNKSNEIIELILE